MNGKLVLPHCWEADPAFRWKRTEPRRSKDGGRDGADEEEVVLEQSDVEHSCVQLLWLGKGSCAHSCPLSSHTACC